MSHATKEQIHKLSSFMETHPELAKSYNALSSSGRTTQRQQWEKLARLLNISVPPTKTVAEWKRVWTLQKYSTKKKLGHNKKSIKQTGGGPFDLKPLDETDEAIVAACGMEAAVSAIAGGFSFGSSAKENIQEDEETDAISQLLDDLTSSPDQDRQDVLRDTSNIASSTPRRPPPQNKVDDVIKKQLELQEHFFSEQLVAQNKMCKTLVEIRDGIRQLAEIENKKIEMKTALKKEELELRKLELEVAKTANELKKLELTTE